VKQKNSETAAIADNVAATAKIYSPAIPHICGEVSLSMGRCGLPSNQSIFMISKLGVEHYLVGGYARSGTAEPGARSATVHGQSPCGATPFV